MQKKGKKPKKGGSKGQTENTGKKGKGKKSRSSAPEYAVDDKEIYGNFGDDPDPDQRDFYYDDVDEFHEGRDQILLQDGYQDASDNDQPGEEEVLALDSEESDDDEIRDLKAKLRQVQKFQRKSQYGSDLEDEGSEGEDDDEEAGLPDSKAWGKKRSRYYGDDDIEVADLHEEEAEANLEEKEALKLQKKLAEQLDDQDFGLDVFAPQDKTKESKSSEEKIAKDLSKLSKKEKLKILKKKSPELLTLIEEFKERMKEVTNTLCPLRTLLEQNHCTGKPVDYINTKFRLNLNYCTNIVFYLMLKAKQIPVHNHPVIKRLLQHKNLLKELEPLDEQFKGEITDILVKLENGEKVVLQTKPEKKTFVRRQRVGSASKQEKRKIGGISAGSGSDSENSEGLYEDMEGPNRKKMKDDRYLTEDEKEALEYYEMMKKGRTTHEEEEEEFMEEGMNEEFGENDGEGDEEEGDSKRAITYQIEKNKGLYNRKRKELRNPRMKHKMKFRKAKIRRRGQVQEVRREIQKYGGEMSGIRSTIAKGIKLRN